jgi:excisionase family DNA binding protein
MTRQPARPVLLTVAEAATQLALNPRQVYRLMDSGELRSVRYPGRGNAPGPRRLRQADVDAFIERCTQLA